MISGKKRREKVVVLMMITEECSCSDLCGVDDDDERIELDRESFSKMLKRVSLAEARLYARMSYLGNLAYSIPQIKVFSKSFQSDCHFLFALPCLYSSIENDEPNTFCSSSAQVPNGAVGFTRKSNDEKSHGIQKMGLQENKADDERESTEPTDEDYIIFCFREDGAIHVVKDGETEASDQINRVNRSSTRHLNHRRILDVSKTKPIFEEHFEKACSRSLDSMLTEDKATRSERDSIICNKKGKEKWSINLDTAPPTAVLGRKNHIEEIKECETLTTQSSDSNQSESSSGSFSFPILSYEGMGSPAQMPKPDALQLRKHHQKAARAAFLQCCRF